MPITITWLGHNAWSIDTGEHRLLIDPFLDDSPTSPVKAADVEADYILLSHGHGDHLGDTVAIAKRTGATVITNYEISLWLTGQGPNGQGLDEGHAIGMSPGGGMDLPFGHVKMTRADHSSSLPDGSYGGVPLGMVLTIDGKRIYFACDTALFLDMKLIGDIAMGGIPVDLAVLPIGDQYTMGPADSIEAIKFVQAAKVLPCHYDTWPPIEQDADAWAEQVRQHTSAEPIVLKPGGALTL